jgi:hypothetical protein
LKVKFSVIIPGGHKMDRTQMDNNTAFSIGGFLLSDQLAARARIRCAFPVTIRGISAFGEHYDQIAMILDIGRRGLCLKAAQILIPGSIFNLYKTDDEMDTVATFEVIWTQTCKDKTRNVGAQLVGDNHAWLRYLTNDVVILPGAKIVRSGRNH